MACRNKPAIIGIVLPQIEFYLGSDDDLENFYGRHDLPFLKIP